VRAAAARCLRCGTPVSCIEGCVLGNRIPEIHHLVSNGHWEAACRTLHATDNFPEFTGRLCGQGCQLACAQGDTAHAVAIRQVECHVVERAFAEGWIQPLGASRGSGKKVAIVGSGPAGLSLAQQLVRAGHEVVVYKEDAFPGVTLRQSQRGGGVDPYLIDRRLRQLAAEGVKFMTGLLMGHDVRGGYLRKQYDLVCLTLKTLGLPAANDVASDSTAPSANFPSPDYPDLIAQLDLQLDNHGRVAAADYVTSQSHVFAVQDLAADVSLVATAIHNGRDAASAIDLRLKG
jgi:glutamate synthase (NADPH) small chain